MPTTPQAKRVDLMVEDHPADESDPSVVVSWLMERHLQRATNGIAQVTVAAIDSHVYAYVNGKGLQVTSGDHYGSRRELVYVILSAGEHVQVVTGGGAHEGRTLDMMLHALSLRHPFDLHTPYTPQDRTGWRQAS